MSEFENWLLEKQAANKILPAELKANAGKIKAAQDPKKPGAEKPDLYAKGKGRGKGGKLVGKKAKKKRKWIPGQKKLEGPNLGKTRTEKISSFREDEILAGARDDIDREFVGWNLEKAAAYTPLDVIDARRNMAVGAGVAAPLAFGAGIAAKTAWDLFKKRRADEAAALVASSQEPVPQSLAKQAKMTETQKHMARGALVEGARALTTGALPAALIAPKGRRLRAAGKGVAYSLAGRAAGGKADQFIGSPTGLGESGGTLGGVAAGLQARHEAKKEKKKKAEMDKEALLPSAIVGAAMSPKGQRLRGAGRGFLYGIPGGIVGNALGGEYGGLVGNIAAGALAGQHQTEKKKKEDEKKESVRVKKAESAQAKATVGAPMSGGAKGLGKLMAGATSPAAGSANALANVTRKLTGAGEKKAAFVQHADNMDLLKKILSKSGIKSVDA
jgi:hypothetical protein